MNGVVSGGIQEFVTARYGTEAWAKVKSDAGLDNLFLAYGDGFDEESLLAAVQSIAEHSGKKPEEILEEFGVYWIEHAGRETFSSFYSLAGTSAREFLLNMHRLNAKGSWEGLAADPERFECTELHDGRLHIHYRSTEGFCAAVRGMIAGLGRLCGQKLRVREIACRQKGEPHCTLEVTFP